MRFRNYKVYVDGEMVFEGVPVDVEQFCGISRGSIVNYAREQNKFKKKYTFVKGDYVYIPKGEKPTDRYKKPKGNGNRIEYHPTIEKPMTDEEYLLYHLKKMGITNFGKDPKPFIPMLKKNGLKVTYRKSIYDKKTYILEVVNAN